MEKRPAAACRQCRNAPRRFSAPWQGRKRCAKDGPASPQPPGKLGQTGKAAPWKAEHNPPETGRNRLRQLAQGQIAPCRFAAPRQGRKRCAEDGPASPQRHAGFFTKMPQSPVDKWGERAILKPWISTRQQRVLTTPAGANKKDRVNGRKGVCHGFIRTQAAHFAGHC